MSKLEEYRKEIDEIDEKLVTLLEQRFSIVKDIKFLKGEYEIPLEDLERENQIKQKYSLANLPCGYADTFFESLFKEAKKEEFK